MAYTAVVLTDLRATAGSVVVGMAATENTVPETQRIPDKLGDIPFARHHHSGVLWYGKKPVF
jgi:hypothetical protein